MNRVIPDMMLGTFNIASADTMRAMVAAALDANVTGFDTAPSYGSESLLGASLAGIDRSSVFIADKIDPMQMYRSDGDVEAYLDAGLKRLKTDYLDLALIHWPFKKYLHSTWSCLCRMRNKGKVRYIGICNLDARTYGEFCAANKHQKPDFIQIEISPFRQAAEDVALFRQDSVMVESYSPLCRMIKDIREDPLLLELAAKYGRSVAQIILRWHLDRGLIPVFTSSKADRVKSNADIRGFSLEPGDMAAITGLERDYKIFPESLGCPGY